VIAPPSSRAQSRARRAALLAAVACTAAGCNRKSVHRRTGDAAPVEVVTMPPLPDGGAGGAASDEIEPNDGDDVATVLGLGASVRGKIDPDADADHYRIDVTQAGALAVMVNGLETLDVVLEIEDPSGAVIARSDRGGARIREGVPNLGVTPGRYTAIVQAKKPPPPKRKPKRGAPPEPAKPIGGPYDITASMVAHVAGAEHEPDDDRGGANDLIAGDTATGYVGWQGDLDVWKVSVEALSARNALDIELSAVEGIALSLEVTDGIGAPIITRKGPKAAPLVVRGFVPAVPQGAPPFHYLTVKADRSNPETAYQIRVVAKVIPPDAEIEPNDTVDTAMAVPADRKGVHAHWSVGDVDCFALPGDERSESGEVRPRSARESAHSLDLSIDTPNDLDLAIELFVDGKIVAKGDHPGKGAAERLTAPVPAGGHAVACVRGADTPGDGSYDLMIN
jgi:hypothetical protein